MSAADKALADAQLVGLNTSRGLMAGAAINALAESTEGRSAEQRLNELRRIQILCSAAIQRVESEIKGV